MDVKKKLTWLLLLLRLPATHKAERVAIWRKLKKSGAIQIQTSTYVLPDEPAGYESSLQNANIWRQIRSCPETVSRDPADRLLQLPASSGCGNAFAKNGRG